MAHYVKCYTVVFVLNSVILLTSPTLSIPLMCFPGLDNFSALLETVTQNCQNGRGNKRSRFGLRFE